MVNIGNYLQCCTFCLCVYAVSKLFISPARQTYQPGYTFYLPKFLPFLNRPNISQHLDRFSRSFYHMKVICMNFLDPDLFFQFLKGRFHSNRFWAKFAKWPLFNTLAFRNGFDYRNFDSKRFNGNIFSTYSTNLIKIGSVIPHKLQIVPRFDDRRSFAT